METSSLDLVYLDNDPKTKHLSAGVYLKLGQSADYAGIEAGRLITAPCSTFIELDAQIRRLHAELDQIRAQAKKKFYKADAAIAGS